MASDDLAAVSNTPAAVEVLFHQDPGLGEARPVASRRYVDRQAAQTDAVVVADGRLVREGDLVVAISLG